MVGDNRAPANPEFHLAAAVVKPWGVRMAGVNRAGDLG